MPPLKIRWRDWMQPCRPNSIILMVPQAMQIAMGLHPCLSIAGLQSTRTPMQRARQELEQPLIRLGAFRTRLRALLSSMDRDACVTFVHLRPSHRPHCIRGVHRREHHHLMRPSVRAEPCGRLERGCRVEMVDIRMDWNA